MKISIKKGIFFNNLFLPEGKQEKETTTREGKSFCIVIFKEIMIKINHPTDQPPDGHEGSLGSCYSFNNFILMLSLISLTIYQMLR